jgi:hypothetical protein
MPLHEQELDITFGQYKLLGALAKSGKLTISFVMSVRPRLPLSVSMVQLGSYWTDFHENLCLTIFLKLCP